MWVLLKTVLVLGAKGGEIVDVEEATVIDVIGGDTPLGEAIRLGLDEFVQGVEAAGIVGRAVDCGYILDDEFRNVFGDRAQRAARRRFCTSFSRLRSTFCSGVEPRRSGKWPNAVMMLCNSRKSS